MSLPMARAEKRIINFGQVPVNERALGRISLYNNGQYPFEYGWVLSERCRTRGGLGGDRTLVSINPEKGMIDPHDRSCCELAFAPPSKLNLKGCEIVLEIVNGPRLPIVLRGSGIEPLVDFSFEEIDFGPCVLHRGDMPPHRKTLVITNKDKKDISVNCLFKNKPYLGVEFQSQLLAPQKKAEAMIHFKPLETVDYCEDVVFEINGLSKRTLTIRGEGARMKVELANPAQKIINFGALRVGDTVTKTVKLVNHSPTPLTFMLSILPSSSIPALQEDGVLAVSPSGEVTLKANGGYCNISAIFSPKSRVPHFSEEVTLECLGMSQLLFVVTGSCHGLEISLDTTRVPFGAVTQHSQSSRRILMINSGDIGASFRWEEEKFKPDFSISPVDGYISPGMQITFDLTFSPSSLNHDIRYEDLPCYIEGMAKPLHLTLSGVCIEKVPFKDVLHFTTTVRSKETRHLTIHNKTNSNWLLTPIIDGEYWSGPKTLSIGPMQARPYELTYHPITMTTDMQKQQGSIFFPQPDGTGLLYNLQGTAEPPKHAGAITQEIPCKTAHTELLPVDNWLRRPQRFRVAIDMIRPEKLDRSVSLDGLDYIDVPALGRKDYQLHFYSFKECSILAKVTFRNEVSGEYLYYHVSFKSTPPGIMGTVELTTAVRNSAPHVITITNPLPTPVTMTTSTNIPDISMPTTFLVGAQSEGKCMFEYLPLKVGETTGKLSLQSSDLGVYQYELHLTATPPPPERQYHFTTHFGLNHQQQCSFTSYAKGRTEYTCKIDNSDFHVDKTLTVASAGSSGTEATVEVTFEPSHLGDAHATLTISSPTGGDYIIPLHGHCLAPKPQGPFIIKPGSSVSIPFKNVFLQTKQFTFSVDNPAFVVKSGDTLKPRKTYNILVTYDAKQSDPKVIKTAKLTVTCLSSAKATGAGLHGAASSWVYYLKGVTPT